MSRLGRWRRCRRLGLRNGGGSRLDLVGFQAASDELCLVEVFLQLPRLERVAFGASERQSRVVVWITER